MKPFDHAVLLQFNELISTHIGLNLREKDSESLSKILIVRMKSAKFGEPERYFSFLQSDTRAVGITIAQDEQSGVVFGMPKQAIELNAEICPTIGKHSTGYFFLSKRSD